MAESQGGSRAVATFLHRSQAAKRSSAHLNQQHGAPSTSPQLRDGETGTHATCAVIA